MKKLPITARIYVLTIILIGFGLLGFSALNYNGESILEVLFFILLGTIAESLPIFLKRNQLVSVSFAISLASIMLFDTYVIVIIRFVSAILPIRKVNGKATHLFNHELYKSLFNGSARAITIFVSWQLYHYANTIINVEPVFGYKVVPILVMAFSYIIVDTFIFLILFSLLQNKSIVKIFLERLWTMINFFAISPLGIIIAIAYDLGGPFAVILFFGPLLLARYSFKLYMDAKEALNDTIQVLSHAMDAKDHYTNGHSHRVAEVAEAIGREMKLTERQVEKLRSAAILHDIGKIGIEDQILNKKGILISVEFDRIKEHPIIGANILDQVHNLTDVANMVRYHHVHYNGGGYPEVPKDVKVPIESYIISVSDAYDAMTSDRPYRTALTEEEALRRLEDGSGTQFHPDVIDSFLKYTQSSKEMRSFVS